MDVLKACFNTTGLENASPWTILIFIFLASIPAFIWLMFFFSKEQVSKKILSLIFACGIGAVVLILSMQCSWTFHPEWNVVDRLSQLFETERNFYIALYIWVGISEEIVKQFLLRVVDSKTDMVKTINDSIKYSLVAALGFAFAENIFYFYDIWKSEGVQMLIIPYVIRSTFTTAMHLTASALFGYYYGISKFSLDFTDQNRWLSRESWLVTGMSKLFLINKISAYKTEAILKGLCIAMLFHGLFDFMLQIELVLPSLLLVIACFAYLMYLLKRKTGSLILLNDLDIKRATTMPKKDEDVVLELVSMWFKDGRFADVIHVCERLLERDPDNNVVKLFKAKALDQMDEKSTYGKVLSVVLSDERLNANKSTLSQYLQKKEEKQKSQPVIPNAVPMTETEEYKKFLAEEKSKEEKSSTYTIKIDE